jgi:hypothetical protein
VLAAAGIDLDVWRAAAHPAIGPVPVLALALDVAADRSSAAIAAAGTHPDDPTRLAVDVLEHRPGIGWVAAAIRELRARYRVAVFADSLVAASIVAELERRHVDVTPVGASDHARACGLFVDRLTAGTLTHRSQAALDDAVMVAARRPLGDAWLWSRRNSGADISPLVAVTLAGWAAASARPAGRPHIAVSAPTDGNVRTRTPTRTGFVQPRRK